MTSLEKDTSLNQNIHVLQLVSGDLWAGAEVMLYTLVKTLHTELNTRVTVVIFNTGTLEQKLRECGVTVFVLDESKLTFVQIFKQLCTIIGNTQPDVLHSHRIKENILGSIAAWYKHCIPTLRTVHGASEHHPSFYHLPKQSIRFLNWFCARFLQSSIVAVSADLANKLEDDLPESKIKMIENGIDIHALLNKVTSSDTKGDGNYHIGIAGRLTPVKRIDLFIDIALLLKQQQPKLKIHFHIYGSGPLQEKLAEQVSANKADDYIHFEGHTENIPQKLQTLDALLMTSDHEGLPMILLEAMCIRTPIIAHAVGGIPELLDHGKCGTLVNTHSSEAFAQAIINLILQTEKYRPATERAFSRVIDRFSAEHTANAYLDLYKKIIRT